MSDLKIIDILRDCAQSTNDQMTVYLTPQYCKDVIAEIDRPNAERRWISVSERLPEDNIEVLIFDGTDIFLACHQSRVPQWSGDGAYYHGGWYDMITHWMPLPNPPEDE